ncbi:hypothetical protein R5R35_003505 [Gryllus longicercus]
MQNFPG